MTPTDALDPIDELDKILAAHRSETWNTGWNNEATAKAKAAIQKLIDTAAMDSQTNAVSWVVMILDDLHITDSASHTDPTYKGIKNTIRDRYKAVVGVDPATGYPIRATLRQTTKDNLKGGEG